MRTIIKVAGILIVMVAAGATEGNGLLIPLVMLAVGGSVLALVRD